MYQKDINSLTTVQLEKYYPVYRIDPDEWETWKEILTGVKKTALGYDIKSEDIRNFTTD
jgi:hypothetical protein